MADLSWQQFLKNRSINIIQAEEQKERRVRKSEHSLKDLWGSTKHTNIHIKGILE